MTKPDYTAEAVAAAKSVMLELFHLLGEYRDDIVLIGGWVPALLVFGGDDPHVGSLDVDIALDHRKLGHDRYGSRSIFLRANTGGPGRATGRRRCRVCVPAKRAGAIWHSMRPWN